MTATQLAFTVGPVDTTDTDAVARAQVVEVIRATAAANHGVVSANTVRPALADLGVPHHVIGRAYRDLRRDGRLVEDGVERSDDVAGGNAGRWISRYRWVEVS